MTTKSSMHMDERAHDGWCIRWWSWFPSFDTSELCHFSYLHLTTRWWSFWFTAFVLFFWWNETKKYEKMENTQNKAVSKINPIKPQKYFFQSLSIVILENKIDVFLNLQTKGKRTHWVRYLQFNSYRLVYFSRNHSYTPRLMFIKFLDSV